ncbi:hypothetical protein C5F49_00280 [Nitrosopumilus oxyclinae]|uniref:Uncharacterized protein n=1 Tax=Nitrosopumilus oxyclinae TaxID=1959104 RepID=A0A7D5M3Y0_9ARCH|nr:hypothetical protein [Nitrosopumilus oxyclinae]QLH03930.1 hypothetical protein C5F49_00280 [Nitrosopumilus oxyclinae]
MNKIIIVIFIAIIIGIGVTASSISMENTEEDNGTTENNIILNEIAPIEQEPEEKGRALTVELTESIGLKSP